MKRLMLALAAMTLFHHNRGASKYGRWHPYPLVPPAAAPCRKKSIAARGSSRKTCRLLPGVS